MLAMPLNANLRLGLLALAGLALAACGSDRSSTPAPTPTPVTTRAFVHVLDQAYDRGARLTNYRLTTLSVDSRTGRLDLVQAPVVASGVNAAPSLAGDPLGRFVYFSPRSSSMGGVRCYRVDAGTGALAYAGEAPSLKSDTFALAPTRTQLLVGGGEPFGHHSIETLRALPVDQSGLRPGMTLSREIDTSTGYYYLLAADAERDVFYASHSFGDVLVAAKVDASLPEGYREVARLDLFRGEGGPNIDSIYANRSFAADGVLLVIERSQLFSFVLNDSPAALVPRGYLANAASREGPVAYLHGLLATTTSADEGSLSYPHHNTGLNLYGVGTGGELRKQAALADGSFVDIYSLGFHPSGRFLYVAGILPNSVSDVSLATFSVTPEGGLSFFASVKLFPVDGNGAVNKMVVTAAPS
jgi:hypothetical protein